MSLGMVTSALGHPTALGADTAATTTGIGDLVKLMATDTPSPFRHVVTKPVPSVSIPDVLQMGVPAEVRKPVVGADIVGMAAFFAICGESTERGKDAAVNVPVMDDAVARKRDHEVAGVRPVLRLENPASQSFHSAVLHGDDAVYASHPPEVRRLIQALEVGYRRPAFKVLPTGNIDVEIFSCHVSRVPDRCDRKIMLT